jgi:hypothetical protein
MLVRDQNTQIYKLRFISQEAIADSLAPMYGAFNGQIDAVVSKIFKDNLETIIWSKYPLNKDVKSKLPNNLIQVSPDNIETDWARIGYKIIKGDNNLTVRLDYPNYIHWFYNTDKIEDLYKTESDKFGFKYKKSPNQGVITLLFTK